jgi:hypothetical protein
VDWRAYLLPAGDAEVLGGVKSMVIDPFTPGEPLSHRLERRFTPFLDEHVLIITGKGKKKEDSRVFRICVTG